MTKYQIRGRRAIDVREWIFIEVSQPRNEGDCYSQNQRCRSERPRRHGQPGDCFRHGGKNLQVECPKLWGVWLMRTMKEDVMSNLKSRDQPNYWLRWIDSALKGCTPWFLTSLAHHTSIVRFPCVPSFESRMRRMITDTILNSYVSDCHEKCQALSRPLRT
jgi:hypothetical protein